MTLPPHIQQVIALENLRRGLAWLELSPELCGAPVVLLTPRILFELHLADNALVSGGRAGRIDVFDFLWRLHPNFRRPDGSMPNRPGRRGSAVLARCARWWLVRHVRRLPLWPAEAAILERIAELRQDELARVTQKKDADGPASIVPKPLPHLLDGWCHWWGETYGCDPRTALDVPVPLILQCRRVVAIAHGEPVIDRSAEAVAEWATEEFLRTAGNN